MVRAPHKPDPPHVVELRPHPTTELPFAGSVKASVDRTKPNKLKLHFSIEHETSRLEVPEKKPPVRAEKLWEHTCFEVFVRNGSKADYRELNFSPSTEWAAYRFPGYRRGMARDLEVCPARISATTTKTAINLWVDVNLRSQTMDTWHLNLATVIEETSGRKSYWALAHPSSGPPDFHDPACFVLELPPP